MNLVIELMLKFLVYFGLITIPKRELRVGDTFICRGSIITREIVSLNPIRYVVSSTEYSFLSGGISEDRLFTEEYNYYLGNIND